HNIRMEQPIATVPVSRPGSAPRESADRNLTARDPTPSQTAVVREQWQLLLEQRSPRDQQIIKFRISGASYDEIGRQLGISQSTVRRAIDSIISELAT